MQIVIPIQREEEEEISPTSLKNHACLCGMPYIITHEMLVSAGS